VYVSVVLFVKEVVEFKLGGFEKIYKRKLEAEFNFQVERERERKTNKQVYCLQKYRCKNTFVFKVCSISTCRALSTKYQLLSEESFV